MSLPISILMPVYNAEATLGECISSIRCQTYHDYEVIVVDDGSDDQTPALLARIAQTDRRFRILGLPRHAGIVNALNHGLAHCRGRYLARMDADDLMAPERLAEQLRFAETHPQMDLIGAQFRIFRDDGAPSPAQVRYQRWSNDQLDDAAIKRAMFIESPIAHPTFFARKAFFETLGGYQDNAWAEDYDFLLRARQHGAIFAKTASVLVEKRDSPNRLYRTDPRCKRKALLRAKAHFFAQGSWRAGKKHLFLAGSGSTGRTVAAALAAEGIAVSGFIDEVLGPPGRTVMGLPALHRNSDNARTLLQTRTAAFFILCIGDPEGRAAYEAAFKQAGLRDSDDYLRFL